MNLKILILIFKIILISGQKPFYQCGGKTFTGTTCCIIGYQCYIQNDYYSQCLTSCPSGWTCQQTQPNLTTPSPIGQLEYSQCGGINWNGSKVCNYGLTCFKLGDYYSQCLYDHQNGYNCPGNQSTGLIGIILTSTVTVTKPVIRVTTAYQNKLITSTSLVSLNSSENVTVARRCKRQVKNKK